MKFLWLLPILLLHKVKSDEGQHHEWNDLIGLCKAQANNPTYSTIWGLPLTFDDGKGGNCIERCFNTLKEKYGKNKKYNWYGCKSTSSCNNKCRCTIDSDTIIRGLATFEDATRNIWEATYYKAPHCERWEGSMYLDYDCRPLPITPVQYDHDGPGPPQSGGRSFRRKSKMSRLGFSGDPFTRISQTGGDRGSSRIGFG